MTYGWIFTAEKQLVHEINTLTTNVETPEAQEDHLYDQTQPRQ